MENPSSPLDTLRQLKEMLDAGALTPAEFEALKQRLVFNPANPSAPADAPTAAPTLAPPAPQEPSASPIPPVPVAPAEPASAHQGWTEPVYVPAPDSLFLPEPAPDFPPPALSVEHTDEETHTFMPEEDALPAAPAERNSSLGLVLAIGAVLVFLAVVAYLGFTRPASEHISSTSQTAADSAATTIETGPQVAPLPAPAAVPETVRVAPTNPAPVIQPRPAAPVSDSVASPASTAPTDSAAN